MSNTQQEFIFNKENYKWLIIAVGVIVLGFCLMAGGGSDDPNVFSEEVLSPRRITLAPIVVMIGFALVVFAILKGSPKKDNSIEE